MTTLEDLMISRVRVKLLELFYSNTSELYYVREITRLIKEEINAVRRELDRMVAFGLLERETRGNRVYYFLSKSYAFYQELQAMVVKSTGLGLKLRQLRRKLGSIQYLMFSARFAGGGPAAAGEVDILVIGEVVLTELAAMIKEAEQARGREISYTVLNPEEYEFRKQRRDPFVMDVLYQGRVMVIGSEEDFARRQPPGLAR